VKVTLYTDPGCPFGFNAQRQELQLMWHYGQAADIERCMIVLNDEPYPIERAGLTPEQMAAGRTRLREEYGTPMGSEAVTEMQATIDACRAYVGARMHDPDRALPLLRALRRRAHSDQQRLDDPATLHAAAEDAGIAPERIDEWLADDAVEAALRADMAAARDPLPEALALAYKLSGRDGNLRYSTSSAVFEHGDRRVVAAGFQPFAVYEVAMASVAPDVERRASPGSVEEVLAWAPFPLATAEIAELRGTSRDETRDELERAGATFTPSANDGYWAAS
jgi:predicted DsbA family dithiol-disulfide isomerase